MQKVILNYLQYAVKLYTLHILTTVLYDSSVFTVSDADNARTIN
jgi:hypothetical protein